jgi:hypothetical protein
MTLHLQTFVARVALVLTTCGAISCDRDSGSRLQGQTNSTITFYGLAVDQDGSPLAGAQFEYRIEAYPKDWTFEKRDRDNDVSMVNATTDARGQFQFTVTGCKLIRRKADHHGYRHLFDEDVHTRAAQTSFYRLIAWGDLWYKTDADHPAVYVFVKDGVKEVSALPCRGGWDSGGAKKFPATPNQPAWPKKPSLKDVLYKPPATAPAAPDTATTR